MDKNVTILTSASVEVDTPLFEIYKSKLGNSKKTMSDFFDFLTIPSLDRELLLSQLPDCSFEAIGDVVIHKVSLGVVDDYIPIVGDFSADFSDDFF